MIYIDIDIEIDNYVYIYNYIYNYIFDYIYMIRWGGWVSFKWFWDGFIWFYLEFIGDLKEDLAKPICSWGWMTIFGGIYTWWWFTVEGISMKYIRWNIFRLNFVGGFNYYGTILPIDELICFKMVNKNHQPVNVNDVNVSWRSLKHWDLGSIYCGGMGVGYYKLANWHRISSGKLT
jgi:hypothetical protein